jgi:hypothetical protein
VQRRQRPRKQRLDGLDDAASSLRPEQLGVEIAK